MRRREFLAAGGALVVAFALGTRAARASASLEKAPMLDAWLRIASDGSISLFTGKAEIGQGIMTALLQVAAEQLGVEPGRIVLVTADTERTPDEGYTAGSNSMKDSGMAILAAATQAREILIAEASKRLGVAPDQLQLSNGEIAARDGRRVGYGALVEGQRLNVRVLPSAGGTTLGPRRVMGKSLPRVDIPRKVTGGAAYVHDLRLPGMVHARVVRPPVYEARLQSVDTAAATRLPGVLKVVRDGSYLAVVCEQEFQAVQAMRALSDGAKWESRAMLPAQRGIYAHLMGLPAQDSVIHRSGSLPAAGARTIEAEYRRPYQMHAAIGPSCAVGLFQDGKLTVWTHSQGVFPLRKAIAELVRMPPESVRCIHMEGSGCYGHNGADDAGADAALIALALPGRPVRVQWMREEENAWEPYGAAMVARARGAVDAQGRIVSWDYEVWSNTHSTRPGPAGSLAPAQLLAAPFAPPAPRPIPQPEGGGDRNAIPLYGIANARVTHHFIAEMPLRVSALRALGAYANVFAIESFMDELALAAQADPVEFRLRHLDDARAREVVSAAAERFGWKAWKRAANRGRGFGFARYKNLAAYCAVALEVEVERESGEVRIGRVVAAVDSGEAVNPDGIRNQVEGGIVQSISWTRHESVTWEKSRITSRDWARYPVIRFPHVPAAIEVVVVDRPGQPFLGTGEAAQGPAAGAFANAVSDAIGERLREIPLDRARVRATRLPPR